MVVGSLVKNKREQLFNRLLHHLFLRHLQVLSKATEHGGEGWLLFHSGIGNRLLICWPRIDANIWSRVSRIYVTHCIFSTLLPRPVELGFDKQNTDFAILVTVEINL